MGEEGGGAVALVLAFIIFVTVVLFLASSHKECEQTLESARDSGSMVYEDGREYVCLEWAGHNRCRVWIDKERYDMVLNHAEEQ